VVRRPEFLGRVLRVAEVRRCDQRVRLQGCSLGPEPPATFRSVPFRGVPFRSVAFVSRREKTEEPQREISVPGRAPPGPARGGGGELFVCLFVRRLGRS
jgi:hypothetical protein